MRFDHAAKIAPLVLLLAGGAATALNGGTASVDTIYGPVLGSVLDGMGIWRSIPFAAPPVGTLRFRAPQAPQPWTTPIDASGFAKVCPQIKLDGSIFDGSEDCLYLSVYAPNFGQNHTSPLRLPVLFWIYGESVYGLTFGAPYLCGDWPSSMRYRSQISMKTSTTL